MRLRPSHLIAAAFLTIGAWAGPLPVGYQIPDDSISPDSRFGVTVPVRDGPAPETARNSLIEIKTGRNVAVINAFTGWDRANHNGPLPARWSKDNSLLVWTVDGKWFPSAVVVLKLKDGAQEWQLDLLKAAQTEILARTKQAAPKKYAAVKTGHKEWGSAYKEGFSIDLDVDGAIALPLRFHVALSSDPKGADTIPKVESHMAGSVDGQGKVTFENFALGPGRSERF